MSASSISDWRRKLGGASLPFVDSRIYTDAGIFAEEIEKIWRRTWLLVVHESELPEPFDFRTTTVAGEPIVIVRGDDGQVRAFLNVCPHRGALLLRQPSGSLRQASPSGSPRRMTCMFHAWQFDSRGQCVAIPRRLAGYQERLDCDDVALFALACEVGYHTVVDVGDPHLDGGSSRLFAVGRYHDELRLDAGRWLLVARTVRIETRQLGIGTHLLP